MSEPYRPSNGSEGACFMERFCFRCWHDRNEDCAILAATLCYAAGDPHYPAEWIEDSQGPRCTQYRLPAGVYGMKRRLLLRWTCCDFCPIEHRWKWTAWLHGKLIYLLCWVGFWR